MTVFPLLTSAAVDVWNMRCMVYHGNAESIRCVAKSLSSGLMSWAIKESHEAFESGADLDHDVADMARHAFEARINMPDALARISADISLGELQEIVGFLDYSDEIHRDHGGAVMALSDEEYDNVVYELHTELFPQTEWYGLREKINRAIPPGLIEHLLETL